MTGESELSIIIPAKNESESLGALLPELVTLYSDAEILVVDDGSTDNTAEICERNGVKVIRHPYSMGNGAAIKAGARHATGDIFVFMDADGQHQPGDIQHLLDRLGSGYDMVVGARERASQASTGRWAANSIYNWVASRMTGHPVRDLTSGFRAVKSEKFKEFIYLLPNGFSYPTTITMAFFRAGYAVNYMPIDVRKREGKSHIHPLKDGVRFLTIIFKVATLYSPLKIFVPFSFLFFFLGLGYSVYTLGFMGRFTNMSVVLYAVAALIFLIGLISEQITALMYKES